MNNREEIKTRNTETESGNQTLVSIAMCTYNGERFLKEQLDSLIAQDYPNLEIIITDDLSTDSTFEILKEYRKKYPAIRATQNETNLGFVKNFEKAISLCSGEFIALCDQDDVWFPHKISTMISQIGTASLIYSKTELINDRNQPVEQKILKLNRLSGHCCLPLLFRNCVTGHVAMMTKRVAQAALPIPPDILYHDQWIAFIAASQNGLLALDEVLSLYRIHGKNASIKSSRKKSYNLIRRRIEKARKMKRKLETRAHLFEQAIRSGVLPPDEQSLAEELLLQTRRLKTCLINRPLRKLLTTRPELLSVYPKPEKACKKLSRGLLFYKIRGYS